MPKKSESDGCAAGGPSCLNCKLPACIYDEPPGYKLIQIEECVRLSGLEVLTHKQIALVLDVGVRTVNRWLNEDRA